MYYVYILYSEKLNKYYIGTSNNPVIRLHYHNLGKKGWTKTGIPWRIVYTQEFDNKKMAIEKERYIKKQKSREYVEKLISGEIEL